MEYDTPKHIHGKGILVSYLYLLRIPIEARVLSTYPETPSLTSEKLRVGTFVEYQDQIFIDGALDLLLIRAAEPIMK